MDCGGEFKITPEKIDTGTVILERFGEQEWWWCVIHSYETFSKKTE